MLRIHFIQRWFNLVDFACEEALCNITSLRNFAGIDLGYISPMRFEKASLWHT
jgi:IS5 family transposase